MNSITRNIGDLGAADRQALERVFGAPLGDNQRVTLQVAETEKKSQAPVPAGGATTLLPEWCQVYAGLTDEEINELDQATKRRLDLGRTGG
jgi:hypothetical protein